MMHFEKKFILDVGFNNLPDNLILEYVVKSIENSSKRYYIVTPNPELLVIAHDSPMYKRVLNNAKLALPDGIGIMLASKLLGRGIKERIAGVDLVEKLCRGVAEKPITVGFLGGGPGVADKTAECLQKKYPGLKVNFVGDEWGRLIHTVKIDILFVAFGSPKQEVWISENLEKLPVKVAIGVGGAFDFISGRVKRAPVWVRNIGLEWFFRFIIQPWRIKRQLRLIEFIFLVVKEKFKIKMV